VWLTAPLTSSRTGQSFDMLKPLLTISEVVSIAALVIEKFAQEKISAKNLGFEALACTISLCSDEMARKASARREKTVSKKSLLEILSRVRRGPHELPTQSENIRIIDNFYPGAK
jgi:hypothetical protein